MGGGGGDYRELLNEFTTQTQLLLENQFCYQALVTALTHSLHQKQQQQQQQHTTKQINNLPTANRPEQQQQQQQPISQKSPLKINSNNQKPSIKITNKISNNINSFSANRRRARSQ